MKNKAIEKLVENIQKYPNNISAAIKLTAGQTKATENQLRYAYYKKETGLRETVPMFVLQSPFGITINGKSAGVKKATKRTLALNHEVIPMKGLTSEEKVSFFDMIFG